MRQGIPAYRQFSYNKAFPKNGKVILANWSQTRTEIRVTPKKPNNSKSNKKHVIIVKQSAPPQNQTARFLKSWVTSFLAYSRTKPVHILKYWRKNKKTLGKKSWMNLSNWYPIHKICLHVLAVQNNLVIQRTVEHKTFLMPFFFF